MVAQAITSLQHPAVKEAVLLRKERSFRRAKGRVVIAGRKLVREVAALFPLLTLFAQRGAEEKLSAAQTYLVTEQILKKITGLPHPEPLAAIAPLPETGDLRGKRFLLALDGISDPGNLGTLMRTAHALGWEGAFLLPKTADPFNDKALRSAKGATFRLPIAEGSWEQLDQTIADNQLTPWLADVEGPPLSVLEALPPLLLVLGNEAGGASSEARRRCRAVSIPMAPGAESLNVASAGSILMYALKRR
jgi:TrmH family RNA methyltransferase